MIHFKNLAVAWRISVGVLYTSRSLVVAAFVAAAMFLGCGDAPPPGSNENIEATRTGNSGVRTAADVLNRMFAVYRETPTYADAGELRQVVIENGIRREQPPVPFAITLERPNRVNLKMFGAHVVCDSVRLRAAVLGFEPQTLYLPAPERLTADNLLPDPILRENTTPGMKVFAPPVIDLLFAAEPQKEELKDAQLRMLDEKEMDSRLCYRVEAKNEAGRRVYWIDKQSFTLRRVDVPVEGMAPKDAPSGAPRLEAWFVLKDARLGEKVDPGAFVFEEPQGALMLTRFVPPPPDPQTMPIGNSIGDYALFDLEDQEVRPGALPRKAVVLEYWTTSCAPCRKTFPKIEAAAKELKKDGVAIYAVNADPADQVDNRQVRRRLADWGVGLPVLRDRQGQLFMELGAATPTTVLLGPRGRVHSVTVGARDDYTELIDDARAVIAGKDVAQQKLDAMRQSYESQLDAAAARDAPIELEIPRAKIAPRSTPERFELELIWRNSEISQPGAVLIVEHAPGQLQFLVLDSGHEIVEFNSKGNVAGRHELTAADQTPVRSLRTATDGAGRRYFVAFSPGQAQLHLYDADWRRVMSYPQDEEVQIADVQLADLHGDGKLSLVVGFLGAVGVHNVSLDGRRLWSNRRQENVWQLAVVESPKRLQGPNRKSGSKEILVTSPRGVIARIDPSGRTVGQIVVRGHAIVRIFAADLEGAGHENLCGLASLDLGRWQAVALDESGAPLWEYDLPEGEHIEPIERVTPARLPGGEAGWLLPGADGSIHLLAHAGGPRDRFNYGSELAGLASAWIDGQSVLVVSSKDGVAAWRLKSRADTR